MGRFLDLMLSENWEQFQRVQLFKKLGKKIEEMPPGKLIKIKQIMEEDE